MDSKRKKWIIRITSLVCFCVVFVLLMFIEDRMPTDSEKRLKESGKILGYTLSSGDYKVNLRSLDSLKEILKSAKDRFDPEGAFSVYINEGELLSKGETPAIIVRNDGKANMINYVSMYGEGVGTDFYPTRGIPSGLMGMCFEKPVTIKQNVIDESSILSDEETLSFLIADKETNKIYIVEPGDCLALVAQQQEMDLDRLLELNGFANEGEILHVGDELIVSVPEPPLSIQTNEVKTLEEEYTADINYVPIEEWYTTQTNTISEGTTGKRVGTYSNISTNGRPSGSSLIAAVILEVSEPAVVEKGTKEPPTYIKPIRGGTFSSGFGPRWGTIHKGIDWACGTGTPVFASSSGVVDRAEYSSSYGYVVYINHPDGRQTRYAHNSRLACKAGQSVKQGQVIAYSGSTGNSTGPHVHFEILIGGVQVNPLKYLQ